MITGDYPGTARHIAQEIGLRPREEVLTGPELDALDDVEVHAIGDCVSPRTVEEAVLEGLEVAAAL